MTLNEQIVELNRRLTERSKALVPNMKNHEANLTVPEAWVRTKDGRVMPKLAAVGPEVHPTESEKMEWMDRAAQIYEQALIETQEAFERSHGQ